MGVLAVLFKVLFVGHSLVGPTLPGMVEAALQRLDGPSVVQAQVINGASLAFNWDHSAEAEGVDARARLAEGGVEALVLTEAQPVAGLVVADSAAKVADWAALAAAQAPGVKVWLYETWPARDTAPLPWDRQVAEDLRVWEAIAAGASARGVPVGIIPAGQAMARLDRAMAAGQVPGLDGLDALFSDAIHLNGKGLYFVAMVQAAALTGKSPEGLPARLTRSWPSRDAALTDAQARALQRVAWEAVSGYRQPAAVVAEAEAVPPPPAPGGALPAGLTAITNDNLALGLAGVSDWTVAQPFLDLMKTARPWVGHLPGQWGGVGHDALKRRGFLDKNGWPLAVPPEVTGLSTLILTDLPADAAGLAGRYVLRWQGNGSLKLEGRAQVVSATPGRVLFDYSPGEGMVILTIAATDPADPIRAIQVVREDREAALDAGEIFNPDYLARLQGVRLIRFMGWGMVNDSPVASTGDRARPDDYTWARVGVPVEVMVALANRLKADAWINLPHMADDALVREMAQVAHDGLAPGQRAWVEYSNEVWNWQFTQAGWAEAQGKARWGQDQTWVQFYALRAAEVAGIWAQVFADAPNRLVRVVAVQTGWLGLEEQVLAAPLVLAEGRAAPAESFDAYAVTGYVAGVLGAEGKAPMVRDWLAQSRAADPARPYALANRLAAEELRDGRHSGDPQDTLAALLAEVLPYHAAVAADHGLRLVMYEGGSHVVGYGPMVEDAELTAFFTQFSYSPEMGAIYADLMRGWAGLTRAPFMAFTEVERPSKWGSWGALRHLGDDNPRWQALARGCGSC